MTDPCYSCAEAVRVDHELAAGGIIETRLCSDPTCETNEEPHTGVTPLP